MQRYATSLVVGLSIAFLAVIGLTTASGQGAGPVPAPAQNPQAPVLRGGTTTVLVDVYPQRDGRIVENLTASDFQVLEDGKPQRIEIAEFVRIAPSPPEAVRRDPDGMRAMFAAAANPRNRVFVAFLDEFHTTVGGSNAVRQPLLDLFDRAAGRDDLIGLMTPRMRPGDLTLGRERRAIEDQLTRYWTWGERQRTTSERVDPTEEALRLCFHMRFTGADIVPWFVDEGGVQRYLDELLIERRREELTLRALGDLVQYLGGLREARTTLILVSDGWILFGPNRAIASELSRDSRFGSGAGSGVRLRGAPGPGGVGTPSVYAECVSEFGRLIEIDSDRKFRDIITAANRANVSFYPVATAGLAVFDSAMSERLTPTGSPAAPVVANRDAARLRNRVSSLRSIAESTDGLAVVQTNDLSAGVRRIADDVSAYYLLAYSPVNPKLDGGFRKIEVKVNAPGLSVRARRGYFAVAEARGASSAAEGTAAAAGAWLAEAALALIPRASPSQEFLTYGRDMNGTIAVVVELTNRAVESGEWRNGGSVNVELTSAGGANPVAASAEIAPASRSTIVRVPAGPVPGPWRVRLRLTKSGTPIDDRFDVPVETGVLLGGLVGFRATPSPRSPLVPVADFQFRRTERLRVEWALLQPLDERRARLLDRRGQQLADGLTVTERQVDGQAVVGADLNLAALSEGEYIIEMTGGSATTRERKLAGFRIVR